MKVPNYCSFVFPTLLFRLPCIYVYIWTYRHMSVCPDRSSVYVCICLWMYTYYNLQWHNNLNLTAFSYSWWIHHCRKFCLLHYTGHQPHRCTCGWFYWYQRLSKQALSPLLPGYQSCLLSQVSSRSMMVPVWRKCSSGNQGSLQYIKHPGFKTEFYLDIQKNCLNILDICGKNC